MPDPLAALITIPLDPAVRERIQHALGSCELIVTTREDSAGIQAALPRVDVAFLSGDLEPSFLDAPRLRWVHCNHAGLERSAHPTLFARGIRLSGAAGRSAPTLAEHALFFLLALSYDANSLLDAQRARHWVRSAPDARRPLAGSTLGIVGLGHIGQALAVRAHALDMRVVAYRRRVAPVPPGVATVWAADAGDSLEPLLETCDHLVLASSLNDATHQIINAEALVRMKSTAVLINVARGGLVDEAALCSALESGRLAGAGLDSFAVEPLPESSPLWTLPHVLITPHQSPRLVDRDARAVDILVENIQRYRADQPLLNELSAEDAYGAESPGLANG